MPKEKIIIRRIKMEVNEKFCVMTQEDELMVDGGIAPILIYTGALAGGWLLGHIVGYFAG